ncbi:uncharacterized protein LOC103190391 isoform X1 [Callorhinchus milii]|uniref:uncharacterized protein LOC103190391 isoform X1 n=1 Tax=Callorhinchus milii TaxID=7868 RepID=UPI0004571613|nr:uncharacterized protein LOC103190391 isoform X1 [Callorhinchus milii]|eukprot:gi/632984829/ref/XP_007909341.1/ PREDICTED: uncharacterized protein LOC103190391 isoform X1 [Callorhinchus milii]
MPSMDRDRLRIPSLLSSLLILSSLPAHVSALKVTACQSTVTRFVNQDSVLPVLYEAPNSSGFLRIQWKFLSRYRTEIVMTHSLPDTAQTKGWIKPLFVPDTYTGRVTLSPENASLFIRDLRLNDTGMYRVTVTDSKKESQAYVNLTVISQQVTSAPTTDSGESRLVINETASFVTAGIALLCLSILSLFLFCLRRRRKASHLAPSVCSTVDGNSTAKTDTCTCSLTRLPHSQPSPEEVTYAEIKWMPMRRPNPETRTLRAHADCAHTEYTSIRAHTH